MKPPQIQLKKLKVHNDMSEETLCYSAEVWVDGKFAFHASNQGTGGGDHYRADTAEGRAALTRLQEYAKTLPRRQSIHLPEGFEQDVESIVSDLIEAEQQKKDRTRILGKLKTHVFILDDGKVYTAKLAAPLAMSLPRIQARYPKAEIITSTTPPDAAWAKLQPLLFK